MYRIFFCLCILTALVGCNRGGSVKIGGADSTAPLPVAKPIQREVSDYVDYTGRTNAKDSVIIQPRVTGYLKRMPFKEGADVKAGDILFEIDPDPYQAQLDAAKAAVKQNEAGLIFAQQTHKQFLDIYEKQKDAVTIRELNQYKALQDQALQGLEFAKANLVSAQLNFKWTTVRSPIDGRISRYYLTAGNLVNQDVTQLTTVVSMDPMYVYFDMDEPTLLRLKRAINDGTLTPPKLSQSVAPFFLASTVGLAGSPINYPPLLAAAPALADSDAPVYMGLQGEEGYPHRGFINFIDNAVNPGTGSISVRGEFKNPRPARGTHLFTPGMFVRVRLPIGQPQQALLVIDRAITTSQGLKSVFVVGADNKVKNRHVTVGALQEDGLRVITSGLGKDDWVLIGGLQQVQDGVPIQTERWEAMPTLGEPALLQKETKKKGRSQ